MSTLGPRSRRFPARLAHLAEALAFIALACREAGLSMQDARRAELAVEELFTNTCTHGVRLARTVSREACLTIQLDVATLPAAAEICFADDGPPFDSTRPPPVAPGREERAGGHGLAIIGAMASSLRYERRRGRNRLRLRFCQP